VSFSLAEGVLRHVLNACLGDLLLTDDSLDTVVSRTCQGVVIIYFSTVTAGVLRSFEIRRKHRVMGISVSLASKS